MKVAALVAVSVLLLAPLEGEKPKEPQGMTCEAAAAKVVSKKIEILTELLRKLESIRDDRRRSEEMRGLSKLMWTHVNLDLSQVRYEIKRDRKGCER